MPPPGLAPAVAPDSSHMESASQTLTVESALRHAGRLCAELGIPLQYRRMHQLVRRAVSDHLTVAEFTERVVAYADPTGERAVRNVMRGAR